MLFYKINIFIKLYNIILMELRNLGTYEFKDYPAIETKLSKFIIISNI